MNIKENKYIIQWIDVPVWYEEYTYEYTGEVFKSSKLSGGQVEGMLYLIKALRDEKNYEMADSLRDRLITTGYYWWMPEVVNTGNLLGHTQKKLEFTIKDGKMRLEGYIKEKEVRGIYEFIFEI